MAWVKVRFYHNATQRRPAALYISKLKATGLLINRIELASAVSIECLLLENQIATARYTQQVIFGKGATAAIDQPLKSFG